MATTRGKSRLSGARIEGRSAKRDSTDNREHLKNSYPLAEAKAHLSKIVHHVEATGQEVVVTLHGKPVARLVPDRGAGPRPLGFARGRVKFKKGWDQPITYEELFGK
jgi:prevent-host-death family protein